MFAKDQAIATINKTITETLEDKLKKLSTAVENMVRDMPDDEAKKITQDLQSLVGEATKEQPR